MMLKKRENLFSVLSSVVLARIDRIEFVNSYFLQRLYLRIALMTEFIGNSIPSHQNFGFGTLSQFNQNISKPRR